MNTLKCLYLEDDKDDLREWKGWIKDSWDEMETHVPIVIDTIDSPEDVAPKLTDAKEAYHLLIADVFIAKKNQKTTNPLGLRATKQAREKHPNIAIIALTVGAVGMEETAILEGKADKYITKTYLRTHPTSKRLGEAILEALRMHGHEPTPLKPDTLAVVEPSLPLETLLNTIGRDNILNFCHRIIKRPLKEVKVWYMRAGLSGASVLRADCEILVEVGHAPEYRKLLLKISRDQTGLVNELEKDINMFPDSLFVPFVKDIIVFSGGWYCIAAIFKHGSKTLIDWLCKNDVDKATIEKTMALLFSSHKLQHVYKNVAYRGNERPVTILWNIAASRAARIDQSLNDLEALARKHDPSNLFEGLVITRFIGSAKRVCDLDENQFPLGTAVCWSHGDLHGRNILIDELGEPLLIDRANVEEMHWAADLARLVVDIIISGWDGGNDSHEWDKMLDWCELITFFVEGTPLRSQPTSGVNYRVYCALYWLKESLSQIHPSTSALPKRDWEFKLALGVEFMRASYRVLELPSPKRVLGLYGACVALRAAEKAFQATVPS
jgi:CheY-like chemotaxis protein